jgi:hypothetical protein
MLSLRLDPLSVGGNSFGNRLAENLGRIPSETANGPTRPAPIAVVNICKCTSCQSAQLISAMDGRGESERQRPGWRVRQAYFIMKQQPESEISARHTDELRVVSCLGDLLSPMCRLSALYTDKRHSLLDSKLTDFWIC